MTDNRGQRTEDREQMTDNKVSGVGFQVSGGRRPRRLGCGRNYRVARSLVPCTLHPKPFPLYLTPFISSNEFIGPNINIFEKRYL
jgi:ABC-type thiamine transport system ATPase subunit